MCPHMHVLEYPPYSISTHMSGHICNMIVDLAIYVLGHIVDKPVENVDKSLGVKTYMYRLYSFRNIEFWFWTSFVYVSAHTCAMFLHIRAASRYSFRSIPWQAAGPARLRCGSDHRRPGFPFPAAVRRPEDGFWYEPIRFLAHVLAAGTGTERRFSMPERPGPVTADVHNYATNMHKHS